jgi:hypothetical protein
MVRSSQSHKYAFNSPKIRFQKYYINCHRQVKPFVFFRSTPPRSPVCGTTPSFPAAVLSPPGGRTRSQGRSQPASQDTGSGQFAHTRTPPVSQDAGSGQFVQALATLRTRGHRRSGNGSKDLEGAAGQVQAPASSLGGGQVVAPGIFWPGRSGRGLRPEGPGRRLRPVCAHEDTAGQTRTGFDRRGRRR